MKTVSVIFNNSSDPSDEDIAKSKKYVFNIVGKDDIKLNDVIVTGSYNHFMIVTNIFDLLYTYYDQFGKLYITASGGNEKPITELVYDPERINIKYFSVL